MIYKTGEKIKVWWEAHEQELFLMGMLVLISSIIFGTGRLWLSHSYEIRSREIEIEENAFSMSPPRAETDARFVASVNGEKYYPAGCKAANRIKEENRIWFTSENEAREIGYTPSAQC